MKLAIALALVAGAVLAADPDSMARGKKELETGCVACHGLRMVRSQRLSKATWSKELDKMANWGAPIADRQVLLDYLAAEYSETKPLPPPDRSLDGSARHRGK